MTSESLSPAGFESTGDFERGEQGRKRVLESHSAGSGYAPRSRRTRNAPSHGSSVWAVAMSPVEWGGVAVGVTGKGRISKGKATHGQLTYGPTKSVGLFSDALISSATHRTRYGGELVNQHRAWGSRALLSSGIVPGCTRK